MSNPTINAYDPIPSVRHRARVEVRRQLDGTDDVGAVAVPITEDGQPPAGLGVSAAALRAAGFTGARGQTLVVPASDGPLQVAVGVGAGDAVDAALVRHLASAYARAVPQHCGLAVRLPETEIALSVQDFVRAVTEGVVLARWRYTVGDRPGADPRPAGHHRFRRRRGRGR